MSVTSQLIIQLLSYSVGDWAVTAEDEKRIIALIRRDASLGSTIQNLKQKGFLDKLFSRVDSGTNSQLLCMSVAGGLVHSSYPIAATSIANKTKNSILFSRSFNLQSAMKALGLTSQPVGFVSKNLSNALVQLTKGKSSSPYTGSGATGVDPKKRSVSLLDGALMLGGHTKTVSEFSNPIGGLSAYLATLTTQERKAQGKVILFRPVISVYAASYINGVPTRAAVIRAAAKKYYLEPALIAGFILAEQRDQSGKEDAKDYEAAAGIMKSNTSIGLGQIVVSTARKHKLFDDLLGAGSTSTLSHSEIARHLTSDDLNIFSVAKYIRLTANLATNLNIASLPDTKSAYPNINMKAFGAHSTTWPTDNIKALASEYTSRAWDDGIYANWADFVFEAYKDILASKVL